MSQGMEIGKYKVFTKNWVWSCVATTQGARREWWEMSWKGIMGSQPKGLERHSVDPLLNSVPREGDLTG